METKNEFLVANVAAHIPVSKKLMYRQSHGRKCLLSYTSELTGICAATFATKKRPKNHFFVFTHILFILQDDVILLYIYFFNIILYILFYTRTFYF